MNGNFFLQILLQNLSYFFVLTQENAFLKGLILRQQEEHRLSFERFQYFNFEKKIKIKKRDLFQKTEVLFFWLKVLRLNKQHKTVLSQVHVTTNMESTK